MPVSRYIGNYQIFLKWLSVPLLLPEEATALCMGFDPKYASHLRGRSDWEGAVRFKELELDISRRFLKTPAHSYQQVIPEFLVNWAQSIELELPAELKSAINKLFGSIGVQPDKTTELKAENAKLRLNLTELKGELKGLMLRLRCWKTTRSTQRQRRGLQVMVLAMAFEQYAWEPLATRNDAPRNIASDAHRLGLGITTQTVRNQLVVAMEQKEAGFTSTKPKLISRCP